MLTLKKQGLSVVAVLAMGLALTGCASSGGGRQLVGFSSGGDCQSVRSELRKLDGMGVPGQIQASQSGQHVSAESRGRIDRYNHLLEEYLGNNCQLPPA